jgi:hypothetical protein
MPRKKRTKLEFTEDGVNQYMQELYDDSFTLKSKIDVLFRKWETKVKENGEVAAIGDSIVKLIGAMAKNQDQRIMILKYLKEIVFVDSKNEDGSAGAPKRDREALIKVAQDAFKAANELEKSTK